MRKTVISEVSNGGGFVYCNPLFDTMELYSYDSWRNGLVQKLLTTELEIIEQLADMYKLDSEKNMIEYKNIRSTMQYAWVIFISAPLIAFLIALWICPPII